MIQIVKRLVIKREFPTSVLNINKTKLARFTQIAKINNILTFKAQF